MKTFSKVAAQGDFIIFKIDDIPENVEPYSADGGQYVVAHSETGHNHVMEMDRVKAYRPKHTSDDKLFRLFFAVEQDTDIVHLRSFDTHETLRVSPGKYEVRRQREYTAEGFRKAAD
jgi:hypothetical protein